MSSNHLAEVWGDIVDTRHLLAAVGLGAATSLLTYFTAIECFGLLDVEPTLQKTYAMLIALIGCLVSCAVCARLFPPKRILAERRLGDTEHREMVAAMLGGTEDRNQPLPEAAIAELRALGLDELIPDVHTSQTSALTAAQQYHASDRGQRHA